MILPSKNNTRRRIAGVSLIECLVYIVIFAILLAGGTAAFYFCWDHTRATIFSANEISAVLQAGETWRADVRNATGKISVEDSAAGETVKIPVAGNEIVYRFSENCWQRETANRSWVLLEKVAGSQVQSAARDGVNAWRWELEMQPHRKESRHPLRFTFAAVQTQP